MVIKRLRKFANVVKSLLSLTALLQHFIKFLKFMPLIPYLSPYQTVMAIFSAIAGVSIALRINLGNQRTKWSTFLILLASIVITTIIIVLYPIFVEYYRTHYPPELFAHILWAITMVIHYSLVYLSGSITITLLAKSLRTSKA